MRLFHAWALASPHLCADAVELSQFPELTDRFRVTAVPTVLLHSAEADVILAGPLPEPLLLARLARLSTGSDQD